jgi:very-short-patch-repair endonuclease
MKLLEARRQRREPTPAEAALWAWLRGRPFGVKFRRVHPILGFLVDFYAPQLALVVEVDGAIHEQQSDADAVRTQILALHGISVIRVSNDLVLSDIEAAVERIREAISQRQLASGSR